MGHTVPTVTFVVGSFTRHTLPIYLQWSDQILEPKIIFRTIAELPTARHREGGSYRGILQVSVYERKKIPSPHGVNGCTNITIQSQSVDFDSCSADMSPDSSKGTEFPDEFSDCTGTFRFALSGMIGLIGL